MLPAGLCGSCRHARVVLTSRGSRFLRCDRSNEDPAYPRYPLLPRSSCSGYDHLPALPTPSDMAPEPSAPASVPAIRRASRGDVPVILDFIRQLAAFEHLEDAVQATEDALHETLFGVRPAAEVRIAALDGRDVGFALFFETYSTFLARRGLYLEDLFVVPEARRLGVGRALLTHLAEEAAQRKCGRLEWAVLTWNTPAIDFYRRLGAFSLDEWQTFRLNREGLLALAGLPCARATDD